MGTETFHVACNSPNLNHQEVKLNNPLMGTETFQGF